MDAAAVAAAAALSGTSNTNNAHVLYFLWINKFACVQQRRQEVHERGGKGNRGAKRSHTSWEIKALLIIFNRLYTYMESACLPALVPRCVRGRECNKLATCPTQLAARCMRSKLYAALIKITALLRYYLSHSLSACVCACVYTFSFINLILNNIWKRIFFFTLHCEVGHFHLQLRRQKQMATAK